MKLLNDSFSAKREEEVSISEPLLTWTKGNLKVEVLYSSAGVGTSIVVETEETGLLLDAGGGVLRDLIAHNRAMIKKLSAIAFSHGHYDHMGGLWTFLGVSRMLNREEKLIILSPPNVIEISLTIEAFKKAYVETIPFEIELIELNPSETFQVGDLSILPFKVYHGGSTKKGVLPEIPTYGYQVKQSETIVTYSGDTCYFEELKSYFEGVDLALVEATMKEDGSEVHLSESEALKVAEGAKEVFLIHKVLPKLIQKKKN
jgi:ribonuclease BN (tRNA processing enzyme)